MASALRIGEITIDRIIEQEGAFLPALDVLPALTPALLEENRHWLEPTALDATGNLRLCVQSFIVRTPHHTVLIDSCIGNDKPRPARPNWNMKSDDRFMRGLSAVGLGVSDIDFVMCTHLHVDHVGWNTRLQDGRWVPTFPNARYVFTQTEYAYWEQQHALAPVPVFADSVLPVMQAGRAELVGSEHALGDHVRLLPTPGHTPGHVSVMLRGGAPGAGKFGTDTPAAVVSGDLIHSPLQARYPELSTRFDVDMAAAAVTRRAFLERFCDTETVCCMTHFPSPSVGRLTRWGGGFRCEALEPSAGTGHVGR
jgi:glyoxylase-like metal-dependent hydrolase (beta-lactamase superfamily II)